MTRKAQKQASANQETFFATCKTELFRISQWQIKISVITTKTFITSMFVSKGVVCLSGDLIIDFPTLKID